MVASEFIKARVSVDLKARVKALVDRESLSESGWLKRLVLRELRAADASQAAMPGAPPIARDVLADQRAELVGQKRVYVRLRHEDRQMLESRAQARGMRAATYVSVLTRSHLRGLAPLPKNELLALRQSIGELAAIGRNLNQIARMAHEGGGLPSSVQEEFLAMLQICQALRDRTKALLKANLNSWRIGRAEEV